MIIVENLQVFLILALIILSITLFYFIYYKVYKKNLVQSKLIPNSGNIAGEGGIIFVFLFLFYVGLSSRNLCLTKLICKLFQDTTFFL